MSTPKSTEWRWVERFAQQLTLCELDSSELCVVLSETTSRPEIAALTFRTANRRIMSLPQRLCSRVQVPPTSSAARATTASTTA